LKQLIMRKCLELTNDCVHQALTKCPKLQLLDLSYSPRVSFDPLKDLAAMTPQLEILKLEGCPWMESVSVKGCALKEINLTSCGGLETIEVESETLVTLHLSWCTKLSVIKVLAPNLKEMDLDGSGSSITKFQVKSGQLAIVDIKNMLKPVEMFIDAPLKTLHFTKSLHISEEIMNNIVSKCTVLENIELSGCKNIMTLTLTGLQNLRSLSLYEMRSIAKIEVNDNLEDLQIAWCGKIKDSHIHDILKTRSGLSIKRLKLRGCPGMADLKINAPNLEYLCIEKCLQLTSLSIDSNNMYRLEIKGCGALKKAYLKCMYVKVLDMDICQQLHYIHFASFANVTVAFVQKLQSIAPNLVTLNLKGSKVTDEAVNFVLDKLTKFEKLQLEDCDISDQMRLQKRQKVDIL